MHLKASKNAKSIAVVPASPECANLPQQADATRLPDILTRGEHLRTQVPKVGAPPGADELWKRSAGEWEDEAKRFVSIHKHSELSRFTAFINPSEVDTKVYTPLWSAYAIFLKRLEHFREIFDPDYRIAALKGEVDELNTKLREVGAQAEAHVKESLELKASLRNRTRSTLKLLYS
jgi:hypothetical protein